MSSRLARPVLAPPIAPSIYPAPVNANHVLRQSQRIIGTALPSSAVLRTTSRANPGQAACSNSTAHESADAGRHQCLRTITPGRDSSGVLALLAFGDRRIRQRLQLDHRRRAIAVPDIDCLPTSGYPAWQGEYLGFGGCLLLGQLHQQRGFVTTELGNILREPGGLGAGSGQFAAQVAISALQHPKEPDVLKTFGMQFVPCPPGIGGLLSQHRGSGDPDFAPCEDTGRGAPGDRYDQSGAGHPDPTETGSNGDDGRTEQREPRVTAQRGRIRFSRRDGGIHEAESSQRYPDFLEWLAAWRPPLGDQESGRPVPGTPRRRPGSHSPPAPPPS